MNSLIKESKLFKNTWDIFVDCEWCAGIIYRNGKYSWYVCPKGIKRESGVEFSFGNAIIQAKKALDRSELMFKNNALSGEIVSKTQTPKNLISIN